MNQFDVAEAIAIFLTDKGVGIEDTWEGTLSAKEQRDYFGFFMGRGTIIINGMAETITRRVTTGWGAYYLNVAKVDAKDLTRSYFDTIRGHLPPKDYKEFLEAVGGRMTENQIEGDL